MVKPLLKEFYPEHKIPLKYILCLPSSAAIYCVGIAHSVCKLTHFNQLCPPAFSACTKLYIHQSKYDVLCNSMVVYASHVVFYATVIVEYFKTRYALLYGLVTCSVHCIS